MSKHLVKSTSLVSAMTMVSRCFGFIRDMVVASFFGAGAAFDAFSIAFRIPNFMRRLFAEGSFSQAFVPVLSGYQQKNSKEDLKHFLDAMTGTLGFTLLIVTILGVLLAPYIVRLFAPGFEPDGDRFRLAVAMLRITFPYLMLISLTALSGAILNTFSRFGVVAFTPVLLNISMITACIWLSPKLATPIIALAWGVFIAGFIQLLYQLPFLRRMGLLPHPRIDFKNKGVVRVLKLMVPALFGVSVGQINLMVDTIFASILIIGSPSWLYFSDRLMEFPLGVFGVAISTVILPHLARHHADASKEAFSLTIDWAMRVVCLIGFPAAIFLGMMAGPLLSTLFQHGVFGAHDVAMAQKSLTAFAFGLWPFMMVKILASSFYAKQDMRTPVKIGVIAMVANILFNLILIGPLAHAGIALATSLSAIVNSGLLFYFLYKQDFYSPRAGWGQFILRIFVANAVIGVWLFVGAGDLNSWVTQTTLWRVTHLLLLLATAVLLYFTLLWLTGVRVQHFLIKEKESLKLSEKRVVS